MSDVVSAGTFIGAVMETAGYMTQAQYLIEFKEFFRYGGALMYTLAGIGGVVSVVLFGSYRAARYLIMGPALFWFLVSYTHPIQAAVWKVGDGDSRGYTGRMESDVKAREQVEWTLRLAHMGWRVHRSQHGEIDSGAVTVDGKYNVAWFFYYTVRLINDLASELTGEILSHENDEDLLFVGKLYGIEQLIQGSPKAREFVRIARELETGCPRMVQSLLSYSTFDLDPDHDARLTEMANVSSGEDRRHLLAAAAYRRGRREYHIEQYDNARKGMMVVSPELREWMKNRWEAVQGGSFSAYVSPLNKSSKAAELYEQHNKDPQKLTCGEVWDVAMEAMLLYAEDAVFENARENTPPTKPVEKKELEELLCKKLGEKVSKSYHYDSNHCERLVALQAVLLLRQVFGDDRHFIQSLKRHANKAQFIDSIPEGQFMAFDWEDGKFGALTLLTGDDFKVRRKTGKDELNGNVEAGFEAKFKRRKRDPDSGKIVEDEVWRPLSMLKEVSGPLEAAFVHQQRYQTQNLKQSIFTWALNLPYFQGVMLYLIAVAYPFIALIVLLPGRAVGFLNIPLAWMWVKSWDIGFALVIILERVIWQIFPNTGLSDPDSISTSTFSSENVTNIINEAMRVDPSYHIHGYYMILSMALFAIPPITGGAILKGKKSVLASFTKAPQDKASEAGRRAAERYNAEVQQDRNQAQAELAGFALEMAGARGMGIYGGGRDVTGAMWTRAAVGTKLFEEWSSAAREYGQDLRASLGGNMAFSGDARDGTKAIHRIGNIFRNAIETGVNTEKSIITSQIAADAIDISTWHPTFGRWGRIYMMNDAMYAALDGTEGYEIARRFQNSINAEAGLFETKIFKHAFDMWKSGIRGTANIVGAVPGIDHLGPAAAMMLYHVGMDEIDPEILTWMVKGSKDESSDIYKTVAGLLESADIDPRSAEGLGDLPSVIAEMSNRMESSSGKLDRMSSSQLNRYLENEFFLPVGYFRDYHWSPQGEVSSTVDSTVDSVKSIFGAE